MGGKGEDGSGKAVAASPSCFSFFCVCKVSRGLRAGRARPDGSGCGKDMSDSESINLIVLGVDN
jgi:hypothetical protein